MDNIRIFRKNDIIIVLVLLLLAVTGLFVFKLFNSGEGKTVKVTVDGELFGEYELGNSLNKEADDAEYDAVIGGAGKIRAEKDKSTAGAGSESSENGTEGAVKVSDDTERAGTGDRIEEGGTEVSENLQIIQIQGKVGECVLVIKDGEAYMEKADCPNRICVHHNAISHKGETIVCLPNRVVIEIN